MQGSEAIRQLQSDDVTARREAARFVFRQYRALLSDTHGSDDTDTIRATDCYPILRTACTDDDPLVRGHSLSPFTAVTRQLDRHLDASNVAHDQPPLRPVVDAMLDPDDRVRQTAFGVLTGASDELLHTPVMNAETLAIAAKGVVRGLESSNDLIRMRASRILDAELATAHTDPGHLVPLLIDFLVGDRSAARPYMSDPARLLPAVARQHPAAFAGEIDRLTDLLDQPNRRYITARILASLVAQGDQEIDLDIEILTAGLSASDSTERIEMAETISELAQATPDLADQLVDHLAVALLDPQAKARRRIGAALAACIETDPLGTNEALHLLKEYHDGKPMGLTEDPVELLAREHPEYLLTLFQRAFDMGRDEAFHRWVVQPAVKADESLARDLLGFYETYLEREESSAVVIGLRGASTLALTIPEDVAKIAPAIVSGIDKTDTDVRHGLEALLRILDSTTPHMDDFDPIVDCLGSSDTAHRNMAAEILVRGTDADTDVAAATALSTFVTDCEPRTSGTNTQTGLVDTILATIRRDQPVDGSDGQTQRSPLEIARDDDRWPLGIIALEIPGLATRFVDTYQAMIADAGALRLRGIGKALAEIAPVRPEMITGCIASLVMEVREADDKSRREAAMDALETVEAVAPDVVSTIRDTT